MDFSLTLLRVESFLGTLILIPCRSRIIPFLPTGVPFLGEVEKNANLFGFVFNYLYLCGLEITIHIKWLLPSI